VQKRSAVSIMGAILWGALLYLGVTVIANAFRQGVAGHPNTGQLRFYVFFPEAMTLLSAFFAMFVTRMPKPLVTIVLIVQVALIPLYLFLYTGGI